MVRAQVTTDLAGSALHQGCETCQQHGQWTRYRKLEMAQEMAGNDSMTLLSPLPRCPPNPQKHSLQPQPPPTTHTLPQMAAEVHLCLHLVYPRRATGCCLTRDIDGDNVGLDGARLMPLLFLHGEQGEGPGPRGLLVRAGGEAQGGVRRPSTKHSAAGALLFGRSLAWGLWQERHVSHQRDKGGTQTGTCCPPCQPRTHHKHKLKALGRWGSR